MFGLGYTFWSEVISVLREIIPVYDKVNQVISLGKAESYRFIGISENIRPGNFILDAGSGFGNMSITASIYTNHQVKIILYDPILEMLKNSKQIMKLETLFSKSSGIFEYMPFRDETFDIVMCGYSLRDAINLENAISEVHRILKKEGKFIIVDLGKPDNYFIRIIVNFYLKYILKILAYLAAGELGLQFKKLYGTYLRWPQNDILYSLLSTKFSDVDFKRKMNGASIIVSATK